MVPWGRNTQATTQTLRVTSTHEGVTVQKDFTLAALSSYEWQEPDLDFFGMHRGGSDEGALYFDQVGGSYYYIQVGPTGRATALTNYWMQAGTNAHARALASLASAI